jgi:uncharacterized membrane protein
LFVGAMLSAFGTFWSGEGLGARWPTGDLALVWLALGYAAVAVGLLQLVRRWRSPAGLPRPVTAAAEPIP